MITAFDLQLSDTFCHDLMDIVATCSNRRPDFAICTLYYDNGPTRTHAYSTKNGNEKSIHIINNWVGRMPISDGMKEHPRIEEGTIREYQASNSSDLIDAEMDASEGSGYDIEQGTYFAIPYPISVSAKGIFFLFAHDEQEHGVFKSCLTQICDKIEKYFDK